MFTAKTYIAEQDKQALSFPTAYEPIQERIAAIRPERYGRTRNYINGNVTYLSPYISRGVISTKQLMISVLDRGFSPKQIEKFLQELAWRDYWQQLWVAHGDAINQDLKHQQKNVSNHKIPKAIVNASTGINAIDNAIHNFYKSGYLHNHVRMYIAAIACNMGGSHWRYPAHWMYYHLLDADWASNALSWQWVAGANSNKKYIANQENINKYCFTNQAGTFVDKPYEQIATMPIPLELKELQKEAFETLLPETAAPSIEQDRPTLLYNFYNLDPNWHAHKKANRILLLEPSVFAKYPVSTKTIEWVLALAKNIPEIQVFTAEFKTLESYLDGSQLHYKEHPLSRAYRGIEEPRDWMFDVKGAYPSFFAFWKRCKKQLEL